jgi:hypothetical protein
MFKHSRHDAIPAGITVLQAALTFFFASTWSSRTGLELAAFFPLSVLLCCGPC